MPVAVSATPDVRVTPAAHGAAAPADRYFGKLKMSALRIRYETMQLAKRYHDGRLSGDQTIHLLTLTEDAFEQWAQRYPKDPWLASTGVTMARLYQELPGQQARDRAVKLYTYVKSQFPTTVYARESRDALHRGVAVKAAQPQGEPTLAPATPSPVNSAPSPVPTRVRRASV